MARRGQHEGSIYRREDGRWTASISLGYEGGKRRRKYFYGMTRREVQEQLTAALRQQQQGVALRSDERQTAEQYLRSWLLAVKPTVRESAWLRYEQYIRVHAIPALGKVPLAKLGPQHLQALYAARLDAGTSPTTVRHLHAVLHHALKDAMRLSLVPRNVTDLVDAPRAAEREMRVYTPQDAQLLLATARAHFPQLYALIAVALTTGMREGELLALKWRDVDMGTYTGVASSAGTASGSLQVRQGRQRTSAGFVDGNPKTRSGRRRILLTPTAIEALGEHRVHQYEARLRAGNEWQDGDLVFPSAVGTPLDPCNVIKQYHALARRAGLPCIRFHDLRHTAATMLLARGVNVKVVSEMLGHADVATTLRVYAHVLPHMQQEAAAAMEEVLRRAGTD